MDDFLAWRRGEKGIPQKPAIITLDVDTFRVQSGVTDSQRIRLSLYHVHLHGLHKRKDRNLEGNP
jgi:hypothetical protein